MSELAHVYEEKLSEFIQRISVLEGEKAKLRQSLVSCEGQKLSLEKEIEAIKTAYLHSVAEENWFDGILRGQSPDLGKIYSASDRREIVLRNFDRAGLDGKWMSLYPHEGFDGPVRILLTGSGGIGDALFASTIARELSLKFEPCEIYVLYENKIAMEVFQGRPHITAAASIPWDHLQSITSLACLIDVFDMVVDAKYVVGYVAPPLSRIDPGFFRMANSRALEWQKYVRFNWPRNNNQLAHATASRGMNYMDLVGSTANLPIDRHTPLDVNLARQLPADIIARLGSGPFVTVHHGADPNMTGSNGIQSKNLPIESWEEIVSLIHKHGLASVQIGLANEQLIPGVKVDLRGKLTLAQTAYLLKRSLRHIDTEGGIVHIAQGVGTRSIVFYGPTPPAFFGYDQNLNIPPSKCGDCWWLSDTWSKSCPRDMNMPECMTSHETGQLDAELKVAAASGVRRVQASLALQQVTAEPIERNGNLLAMLKSASAASSLVLIAAGAMPEAESKKSLYDWLLAVTELCRKHQVRFITDAAAADALKKDQFASEHPRDCGSLTGVGPDINEVILLGYGIDLTDFHAWITEFGRIMPTDGRAEALIWQPAGSWKRELPALGHIDVAVGADSLPASVSEIQKGLLKAGMTFGSSQPKRNGPLWNYGRKG